MGAAAKLIGKKFGMLTVLSKSPQKKKWVVHWDCICECGVVKSMSTTSLSRSLSCGCEGLKKARERFTSHGLSRHPLYSIWNSMKDRCYYTKHIHFDRYGGRGIYVCDRWIVSLNDFIEDMYPSYVKGLQLDRIDNNLGYSKDNCKWSTREEQAINRSTTVFLTINKETMCLQGWADKFKLNYSTVRQRYTAGYSDEECVFGINRSVKNCGRVVFNTNTKEYFDSVDLAAQSVPFSYTHLSRMLRGEVKNKTDLIWVKDPYISLLEKRKADRALIQKLKK